MRLFFLFSAFLPMLLNAQQTLPLSHFTSAQFIQNPAQTALDEQLTFTAQYQHYWLGYTQAPRTAIVGIEIPILYEKMSIGGHLLQEETGLINRTKVRLMYNYKLNLGLSSSDELAIGIAPELEQWRLNALDIIASEIEFMSSETLDKSSFLFDAAVGIYYNSDKTREENLRFFVGASANQLLATKFRFSSGNLDRALHMHGIIGFGKNSDWNYIEPSIQVNYVYPNNWQAMLFVLYERYETFWIRGGISNQFGTHLQLGWHFFKGQLRFGTAVNYGNHPINSHRGISYEALLQYTIKD